MDAMKVGAEAESLLVSVDESATSDRRCISCLMPKKFSHDDFTRQTRVVVIFAPFLFVELGAGFGMVLQELAGGELLAVLVSEAFHHVAVPEDQGRGRTECNARARELTVQNR